MRDIMIYLNVTALNHDILPISLAEFTVSESYMVNEIMNYR